MLEVKSDASSEYLGDPQRLPFQNTHEVFNLGYQDSKLENRAGRKAITRPLVLKIKEAHFQNLNSDMDLNLNDQNPRPNVA